MTKTVLASVLALLGVWWLAMAWQGGAVRSAADHRLLLDLNQAEGQGYRQKLAGRDGVVNLGNGLLLQMLRHGTGPMPQFDDWLRLNYRGRHVDGRIFDDTFRRDQPVSVALSETIAAWQRVLPSMPVGSVVRLITPPELAYGEAGAGPVGPGETLEFEIELLGILPAPTVPERTPDQQPVPGL